MTTHTKSKWEQLDPYLCSMTKEEDTSKWGKEVLFGGPVWNAMANSYNTCFPYMESFHSFYIPIPASLGRNYMNRVKDSIAELNQLQQAVGRLVFWDEASGSVKGEAPTAFLSGFFVSPTTFVTRPHMFGANGPKTPKISIVTETPDESWHLFPFAWMPARLTQWDQTEDLAVFELVKDLVPYHIPISEQNIDAKLMVDHVVVAIGYNGIIKAKEAENFYDCLPVEERPSKDNKIEIGELNKDILFVGRKSISPGIIVATTNENIANEEDIQKGLFYLSCSLSGGFSGAPIFLLQKHVAPRLIGLVWGSKTTHNFNRATLFTPSMLATIRNPTKS